MLNQVAASQCPNVTLVVVNEAQMGHPDVVDCAGRAEPARSPVAMLRYDLEEVDVLYQLIVGN